MELAGGGYMSYKIAIASSDGINIDETFGSAKVFTIYEVMDGVYSKLEDRTTVFEESNESKQEGCKPQNSCGTGAGCAGGAGGGCGGPSEISAKVSLVLDCRCVVCKKIGFNVQKQLERKAISSFDVSCTVEEALSKISRYFNSVDNHESLRKKI